MKKMYSIILAIILMFSTMCPVYATEEVVQPSVQHIGGATLIGEFADNLDIEFNNEYFFKADIMNPGDRWKSVITLKNTSDKDMQISLVEIKNVLKDTMLYDILYIEIYLGNDLIYTGDYNKIPAPVFYWINFPANSMYELNVYTYFPAECGNEYQNKSFETNWTFEVRAANQVEEEEVRTGDQSKDPIIYSVLGITCLVAIILLVVNKKEDKEDEKAKKNN